MLDAYTIRKAIPRLVIAVVAINLSIYLCVAALDITTIVGKGLNQLLVGPFLEDDSFSTIGIDGNVSNTIVGVLGAGAVLAGVSTAIYASVGAAGTAIAGAAIGIIGLLLPLFITIALIALAVLFTLIIRQGLLIFLTIISPVAIAMSILPGTEKYFKQWLDLFTRTLMIYPIIAAIFAMSNVLASILLGTSGASGPAAAFQMNYTFGQSQNGILGVAQLLVAILVLYAPLFLIPFAFKLAGGAIAAVANIASGAARKGNLGARAGQAFGKARQNPNSYIGSRDRNFKKLRQDKGLTPGQIIGGTTAGIKSYRGGGTFRGAYRGVKNSVASTTSLVGAKEFSEQNQAFSLFNGDDSVLWAAKRGKNAEEVRAQLLAISPERFANAPGELNQVTAQVMRAKGQTSDKEFQIAASLAMAKTGTGYNYGMAGDDMLDDINTVAGTDGALAGKMLGEMRGSTVQSGRIDLGGGGFGKHIGTLSALRDGTITTAEARQTILEDVVDSNAGQALTGKPKSVEYLAPILKQKADAAIASGSTVTAARELASLAGKYDAAASISPNNARALANGVLAKNIQVESLSPDMQKMLAGAINEYEPGEERYETRPDPANPGGSISVKVREDPILKSRKTEITYQQAIEALRGNADFRTMRREYANEAAARVGAGATAPDAGAGAPPE